MPTIPAVLALAPSQPYRAAALARLSAFIAGHAALAAAKPADAARAHLESWAARLNQWMLALGEDAVPAHLAGLDAFDLADARDALMAAAPAEAGEVG